MAITNKIIIQSRLKLLKRTVLDFVNDAYKIHADIFATDFNKVIETTDKGIEEKLIKRLTFIGRKDKKVINRVVIAINWEKHEIICETSDQQFQLDPNIGSIAEQISRALKKQANRTGDGYRSHCKLTKI